MDRRSFLRVGLSAAALFGMNAAAIAQQRTRTKVMYLFLSGGLGIKESVQPDPEFLRNGLRVPEEYRGPFGSIPASNGTRFCEYFPQFASRAHQVSIIRSFHMRGPTDHTNAMRQAMLLQRHPAPLAIGHRMSQPGAAPYVLLNPGSRFIALQTAFLQNEALRPLWHPTQQRLLHPFSPEADAARRLSRFDDSEMEEGEEDVPVPMTDERLDHRQSLLNVVNRSSALQTEQTARMEGFQQTAFDLSRGGGSFFQALSLPPNRREQYGSTIAGDLALTGVQFLQQGAGAVVVYYEPDSTTFDYHTNIEHSMREHAPPIDRVISLLIEEAHRNAFTLVVTTEFNRTPRMNRGDPRTTPPGLPGRDHHAQGNWAMLCGPNVLEGAVIGSNDYLGNIAEGAMPQSPGLPNTVLRACGFSTPEGQPYVRDILR